MISSTDLDGRALGREEWEGEVPEGSVGVSLSDI